MENLLKDYKELKYRRDQYNFYLLEAISSEDLNLEQKSLYNLYRNSIRLILLVKQHNDPKFSYIQSKINSTSRTRNQTITIGDLIVRKLKGD